MCTGNEDGLEIVSRDNNYNVSCQCYLLEAEGVGESHHSLEITESVDRRCSCVCLEDGMSEGI